MRKPVLADTSLCAIVRDEMMNPAGGIVDFIESIVSYEEQAVIVDTGSIDGTREVLEQMEAEFPNLCVVDIPFEGYAQARNASLNHVQTKRALILDADERFTMDDFRAIEQKQGEADANTHGFEFKILDVSPSTTYLHEYHPHSVRLFDVDEPERPRYINHIPRYSEFLYLGGREYRRSMYLTETDIQIKHFIPDRVDCLNKWKQWYDQKLEQKKIPPLSRTPKFHTWKKYNPQRELYS